MKIIKLKYILLISLIGVLYSCDDYLDANALERQTSIKDVFSTRKDAERFLANVYSSMKTETDWSNGTIWTSISDELDVTYQEYGPSIYNGGSMTASAPIMDFWSDYYKGIRSANYFIQHIDDVPEEFMMDGNTDLRLKYKAEARYLRAYFYFCLFKQYGPVILMHDEIIPSDASIESFQISRNTISETVNYILGELDAIINEEILPKTRPHDLTYYGRITEATCKALKSRLLLYAASDFYNRDINPYYKDFKNADGTLLFDYTNEGKVERWQAAAKAAKDVMEMGFDLYREYGSDGATINPYTSYKNLFLQSWNNEVIYARPSGGFEEMDKACTPQMVSSSAYNGWAPTQQMVDAYFMGNGLSPILGYETDGVTPIINAASGYTEDGFNPSANAEKGYAAKTFNMYINREPRFYVSIAFNNSKWIAKSNTNTVQLYAGGNSGYHEKSRARNFSRTGYLAKKLVSPDSNPAIGTYTARHYIYFRLAEIYLNYAEALNELGFDDNRTEIYTYINLIRERAGIPTYGFNSNQIQVNSQAEMRELIRKERRVELAFESHRYFDCKRWLISDKTDGGKFSGMNVFEGDANFHKRTVFETRSFTTKNYLWPMKTVETYKNKKLVQNPEW